MPTYEYHCKSCRHELEVFQSMKDAPRRKCPACARNTLERKIGLGAAVLFKGSGFYQTDYRSPSYKKAAEAEKPAAEKSVEKTPEKAVAETSKPAPPTSHAKNPGTTPKDAP
jgi:putative FmdB family regulatory protein